jgi:hypothetical protein
MKSFCTFVRLTPSLSSGYFGTELACGDWSTSIRFRTKTKEFSVKKFGTKGLCVLTLFGAFMLQGCNPNIFYGDGGWGTGGYYGGPGYGYGYGYGRGWGHGGRYGGGEFHCGGGHGGGGFHGGGHGGGGFHGGGGHGGGGHHMGVDSVSTDTSVLSDNIGGEEVSPQERMAQSVQAMQRDFGISQLSAERITAIGQSKHLRHELKAMGINPKDFAPLEKLEMPAPASINAVANTLGEDSWKIEKMFSSYISDMKAIQ